MANSVKRMVDTGFHRRRLAEELSDPDFPAEYERARAEIAQIEEIMRQLDELRVQSGFSKAELARRIGKTPSTVRRLFTAEVNPELRTIAAIAVALGAELRITSRTTRRKTTSQNGRSTLAA